MSTLPLAADKSRRPILAPISASDWIATFLGIFREATHLTLDELATVEVHLDELMNVLGLDDMIPVAVPSRVWAEHRYHNLSRRFLTTPTFIPTRGPVKSASNADWVAALTEMLYTAYPDMAPEIRLLAAKTLGSIVDWLDLENRSIRFLPEEVMALYTQDAVSSRSASSDA